MIRSTAYYAAALDHLPTGTRGGFPQGAKTGLTLPDRAKLDALRPAVLVLLHADGLTRAWLTERTGVPLNHVSQWLRELGAASSGGAMWRLPSLARVQGRCPG